MTIETKYNIGDEVWCYYINDDWSKPYKKEILRCCVGMIYSTTLESGETHVTYSVNDKTKGIWTHKHETECFSSKDELLKNK